MHTMVLHDIACSIHFNSYGFKCSEQLLGALKHMFMGAYWSYKEYRRMTWWNNSSWIGLQDSLFSDGSDLHPLPPPAPPIGNCFGWPIFLHTHKDSALSGSETRLFSTFSKPSASSFLGDQIRSPRLSFGYKNFLDN